MSEEGEKVKKRFKIFGNEQAPSCEPTCIVPSHITFNQGGEIVLDHSRSSSNNCDRNSKTRRARNKIFQPLAHYRENCRSFSLERASNGGSMYGSKPKSHSIFRSLKNDRNVSQQDHLEMKDAKGLITLKLQKTRTEPFNSATRQPSQSQRQQILKNYFEQQLQKKLMVKDSKQVLDNTHKNSHNLDNIMKPQQFATMIKQLRKDSKYKRSKNVHPVLKIVQMGQRHQMKQI